MTDLEQVDDDDEEEGACSHPLSIRKVLYETVSDAAAKEDIGTGSNQKFRRDLLPRR